MKIQLSDGCTARELPGHGVVDPGGTVDVPKTLAESLIEQSDVWSKTTTKKSTTDNEEG